MKKYFHVMDKQLMENGIQNSIQINLKIGMVFG